MSVMQDNVNHNKVAHDNEMRGPTIEFIYVVDGVQACNDARGSLCVNVRDFKLTRSRKVVQECVNLSIHYGQGVVMRGANGCGKTTLIHQLAGVLGAGSSKIDMGIGGDRDGAPAHSSCYVACDHVYIPQDLALITEASVEDNILFYAHMLGVRLKKVSDFLRDYDPFDIAPFLKKPVDFLSHGQKRRASLTRLMLVPGRVWLLDEPDQGLDAHFKTILWGIVRDHCARGGAFLMATHDAGAFMG